MALVGGTGGKTLVSDVLRWHLKCVENIAGFPSHFKRNALEHQLSRLLV